MVNSKERYQKLLVGPIERFDQRNDMFRRSRYDPEWIERGGSFYGPAKVQDKAGYTPEDYALRNAAWYVEDFFASSLSERPSWKLRAIQCERKSA